MSHTTAQYLLFLLPMKRSIIAIAVSSLVLGGCFFQKQPEVTPTNTGSVAMPTQTGTSANTGVAVQGTGELAIPGEPAAMTDAETEATMKEIESLINEAVNTAASNSGASASGTVSTGAVGS